MSSQNGTTDRIRALLAKNGPMTVAEMTAALGGDIHRDNVSSLVCERRRAGEFRGSVVEGKATYALVADFVKKNAKKTPWHAQRAPESLTPPAPSSASPDAPTGPARAASESPAPPRAPDVSRPPRVTVAAAPESLPGPAPIRGIVQAAAALADDIEGFMRTLLDGEPDWELVRAALRWVVLSQRLATALAARAEA